MVVVQHDHQHAQAEHDEGKPALAFVNVMRHRTASCRNAPRFKTAQRKINGLTCPLSKIPAGSASREIIRHDLIYGLLPR
jgi:hypothetical protein